MRAPAQMSLENTVLRGRGQAQKNTYRMAPFPRNVPNWQSHGDQVDWCLPGLGDNLVRGDWGWLWGHLGDDKKF